MGERTERQHVGDCGSTTGLDTYRGRRWGEEDIAEGRTGCR